MSTKITCPNCNTQFEPNDALRDEIQKELRNQMVDWQRKKEDEFKSRETLLKQQQEQIETLKQNQEQELKTRLELERKKIAETVKEDISKKIAFDYETKVKFLEDANKEREEELKTARQKELAFLKKEEDLLRKEQDMELEKQRMIQEERTRISEELKKQEDERFKVREQEYVMKQKELEKQLDDQRKLAEEALRKAEQGSMQLQGEIQELALEDMLRQAYPFDKISEVGKGVRGADCILTVRNALGQDCGCIIFESKRTQNFGGDWIDKLKNDMVSCAADIAVIVTQTMPKDMDRFGERQGVYVCTFAEASSLVGVLRQAILKIYEARKSQENKGDKMVMLYDYLTGSEFMSQWNNMRDSFRKFRATLQKEREDFEKNWKKKEKLLEVIINNSLQISGSIEGISGMERMDWTALPEENSLMLDPAAD